jgi:hypothetical protein
MVILVVTVLAGTVAQAAADAPTSSSGSEPALPLRSRPMMYVAVVANPPAKQHTFWDRTNVGLYSGIAIMRTLDYTSSINMQKRGREEILLPDDVVFNRAGFAALEAAAVATSVGISYVFHKTGHHKLERWLSIGHISVTGFGDARNYSLHSKHRVGGQKSEVRLQK